MPRNWSGGLEPLMAVTALVNLIRCMDHALLARGSIGDILRDQLASDRKAETE